MNKLIFKLFYCSRCVGNSKRAKRALCLFLILAVAFSIGCDAKITGRAAEQIPAEVAKKPEVYFCPEEDCSKIYEAKIRSSNLSVYCAFYDIGLRNIISALARKSKTIDVKLVTDSSNYKGQIKGEAVKLDDNKQLMHNKFCIIDNGIVITGSFNPTDNDNNYNNNNIVVVYSNILAKNYEDEFNELWNGRFGNGDSVKNPILHINGIRTENYFCPEDKCASHVVDLIKNAESSVYFMAFSFTNEEIADALIMKGNLDIRGVFDSSQSSSKFSQFKRLQEFGLKVKKDSSKYKMHHKVFIIDNQTVVTGSFNPTLSADSRNDENLLIMHDKRIAKAFLNEFEGLWP